VGFVCSTPCCNGSNVPCSEFTGWYIDFKVAMLEFLLPRGDGNGNGEVGALVYLRYITVHTSLCTSTTLHLKSDYRLRSLVQGIFRQETEI